jgi:hypothetical protein
MADEKTYEIQDEANCVLQRLPGSSNPTGDDVNLVSTSIEHLANFELIKAFPYPALDETSNRFSKSFDV